MFYLWNILYVHKELFFNFAKVVMIYDFDLMIYYFLYRMTVLFELLPVISFVFSF
jgi:hypothetical protein